MRAVCHAVVIALLLAALGCGSGKPAIPATPEAAVTTFAQGMAADKPEVIWQALPDSYQKDVNDLIGTFAKGMDADLYNQSFNISKKLVQVLKTKKDLIITHPDLVRSGAPTQQLAQNWDTVVNLASVLVNSELSDLNKVKTLDVEKFLAGTGSQVMKGFQDVAKLIPNAKDADLKSEFTNIKVSQVKTEGDTVTLKIESSKKTEEKVFKKVEGKWIPKEVADDWKQNVAKMKSDIEKGLANTQSKNKDMIVSQLKMFDAMLDQMLAAKTADEFNSSVAPLMLMLGAAMQNAHKQPHSAPSMEPVHSTEEKDGEEAKE